MDQLKDLTGIFQFKLYYFTRLRATGICKFLQLTVYKLWQSQLLSPKIILKRNVFIKVSVHYLHVSGFSNSLSRTEVPVAAVLKAAELSFSLDLEAMSISHSTSSPTWQHKLYFAE